MKFELEINFGERTLEVLTQLTTALSGSSTSEAKKPRAKKGIINEALVNAEAPVAEVTAQEVKEAPVAEASVAEVTAQVKEAIKDKVYSAEEVRGYLASAKRKDPNFVPTLFKSMGISNFTQISVDQYPSVIKTIVDSNLGVVING